MPIYSFFKLSPPEAWHVERSQPKQLGKMPKLVEAQWLRENVGYLQVHVDMLEINVSGYSPIADIMIIHFYVLRPCIKHWVSCYWDCRNILVLDHQSFHWDPNGFTCSYNYTHALYFCVRQSYYQLLLTAPRDCSIVVRPMAHSVKSLSHILTPYISSRIQHGIPALGPRVPTKKNV